MTVTSRVLVALFLVFASVASSFRYGTIRRATGRWVGMIHFNENIEAFDSVLYDMPVSNNGARVRMVLKEKGLLDGHHIVIRPPSDIGGLKSEEYLALNPQGKMPLYVNERGMPIPESDTICQYIIDRYKDVGENSFTLGNPELKALDRHVIRIHDMCLLPIQGCMYKAPGNPFGSFGTDRKAAIDEFLKQLGVIDEYLSIYDRYNANRSYKLKSQFEKEECNYLCGNKLQLSDCTLYPTLVFAKYMLPQFFDIPKNEILGPNLQKWWCYMTDTNQIAKETKQEIENTLNQWRQNGRWDPIVAEMKG